MRPLAIAMLVLWMWMGGTAAALASEGRQGHAAAHAAEGPDLRPHPQLSDDGSWTKWMAVIAWAMFAAAAIVGPLRGEPEPEVVLTDDSHGHGGHDAGHGH